MPENRLRSTISIWLASVALAVSAATAYWNLWRPVEIDLAVGSDMFISNTLGGVPDAFLHLVLRGSGSSERAVTIQRIELKVTNETTNRTEVLEAIRGMDNDDRLPFMVQGKSVEARRFLFRVNDYLDHEVQRVNDWLDTLSRVVPDDEKAEVEAIRQELREALLGLEQDVGEGAGPEAEPEGANSEVEAPAQGLDQLLQMLQEGEDVRDRVKELLANLASDERDRVLFVTPGRYQAELVVYGPFEERLAERVVTFHVGDVLAEALRRKFDRNLRVALAKNGPDA